MNYLAHAFLSPTNDAVLVGNIAGDFIRSLEGLPDGIRRGVMLHRHIDSHANSHPAFRRSVHLLTPDLGHYARAVIDILYDHLLARQFERYTGASSLHEFVKATDSRFQSSRHLLPEPLQNRWQNLNWLTTYADTEGVASSLQRLSRRARRNVDLTQALPLMDRYRDDLAGDLAQLLPELQCLVAQETNP